ncbi:hypothetical protein KUTeg_006857 [Tegillarca granosa]|uniref:POPDC1-3 domain-containing protein n=1 Tax=Tegillarca granosa TaxID=220873 RepID=A0ABQ9FBJ1_TEGGR|nr:hypothetical protein KUTeg_006857 [Tegillarca granosa]
MNNTSNLLSYRILKNIPDKAINAVVVNHGNVDFVNESYLNSNWTDVVIGCFTWTTNNHFLFQLANCVVLIGLLAPAGKHGVLFMHSSFVIGFLLLSIWAWVILCAPDFFSWNFAFMVINAIQMLFLMYNIRPIKFCDELEDVYVSIFQPLRLPRRLFRKMVSPDCCTMATLHEGEAYATQGISKTDKLGLLISGRMNVFNHNNLLHQIAEKEFIDSPEFESSVTGDEKYQVCSPQGSRMDIRLPTVSSSIKKKKVMSSRLEQGTSLSQQGNCMSIQDIGPIEVEDNYVEDLMEENEKTELLNGHLRPSLMRGHSLSTCSETPSGSHGSVVSGLHMNI